MPAPGARARRRERAARRRPRWNGETGGSWSTSPVLGDGTPVPRGPVRAAVALRPPRRWVAPYSRLPPGYVPVPVWNQSTPGKTLPPRREHETIGAAGQGWSLRLRRVDEGLLT